LGSDYWRFAVAVDYLQCGLASGSCAAGAGRRSDRDDIPHTVVSDDKIFKSKVLDTDQQFSFTFAKPGTYPYFCSVHPKMTGKIVVN
jgi:hypothetical protein